MINYNTLDEVKTYLGISGTSEDTQLNSLLLKSFYLLNSMLGVDDLNLSEKSEVVDTIYSDGTVFLHNVPVVGIIEINNTTYTGVLNTDYQIVRSRKVTIKDISTYLVDIDFKNIEFIYQAGYDRDETGDVPGPGDQLPEQYKLMQLMTIDGLKNNAGSEGLGSISEYKLGEETIKYSGSTKTSDVVKSDDIPVFQTLLTRYKLQDVHTI